jgi:hypothetical protein
MCNDLISFSTFKMLSLPILLELGDNQSVISTHCGFIDVIQRNQINSLHIPAFGLSFLSINRLEWGG